MVLMAGGALVIVPVLVALLTAESNPLMALFMFPCALVAGWSCVRVLLLLRRPPVVIGNRGVLDNTSVGAIGVIPWGQATGFYPVRMRARTRLLTFYAFDVVGIVWADENWVRQRMGPLQRATLDLNRGIDVPPGALSADNLTMSGVELADLLNEQRRVRRPDLVPWSGLPGAHEPGPPTEGGPA